MNLDIFFAIESQFKYMTDSSNNREGKMKKRINFRKKILRIENLKK